MNLKRYRQQLSELVALPSVSCTSAKFDMSNRAVVERLANWLDGLGFKAELQEVEGVPGKVNLVASLGSGPGGLVLSGHTDTVPCNPELWQQDPYVLHEREGRLYGLGSCDMKGFFPTILAALEQIDVNKIKQPIIVLATADEESSMSGARALAQTWQHSSRFAVIGEPTGLRPIRMHKGIMMEAVRAEGSSGHSSNPTLGHNALEAMNQVMTKLLAFRHQLQEKYHNPMFEVSVPTLNLGCIHGGDNPNRICGACDLHFDLRPLPGMPIADLRDQLSAVVESLARDNACNIQLNSLFPGVDAYEEAAQSELVRLAEKLSGYDASAVAFATEAPFLQALGMQTIVMGPGSIDQAHQPNEFIDQAQLPKAADTLSRMMHTLCY